MGQQERFCFPFLIMPMKKKLLQLWLRYILPHPYSPDIANSHFFSLIQATARIQHELKSTQKTEGGMISSEN